MNQNYQRYLDSDDWKNKRGEKLARKGGRLKRCAICADTRRLNVHHLRYERDLTKTQQEDLRVLCRQCHQVTHELLKDGVLRFRSQDHNHRFTLTKTAVKKFRGLTGVNCFR